MANDFFFRFEKINKRIFMVLEFIVCVRGNNILLVSLKAVTSEGGKE